MKKLLNLENLIYLTVFFLPLYLIRFEIFSIPTNVLELIIAGIFFIWLFSEKERLNWKSYVEKYKKYIVSIVLIFVGLIFSTFLSGNNPVSFGIMKSWFLIPLIFLFLAWEIIPKEKADKIFLIYFFSAGAVSAMALGYLFLERLTFDGRLSAFFNSPNYLAMYLAPAMIIALEQAQNSRLKIQNCGSFFILLIISTVFYFTYSYAAWFSVILAILILSLIKNRISFRKILIAGCVIAILFFSQADNIKLRKLILSDSRSSLVSRGMIWRSAAQIIKDNLVFGIGPGNFQEKYLEYQKYYPPYLEWAVPHPHNIFLAFWLYGGILGLVGFLSLIFLFFKNLINKKPSIVICTALGIMLVILIHGIFDTTYFKNDLSIIFWLNFLALRD